ncbi:MAG: M13 family peptidase [Bacteroidales bacterium]|nr:M13 family peptidase [Bacteroidales bacterium]
MKINLTLKLASIAIISMILTTSCQQKVDKKITLDVSLTDTTFDPAENFFQYANNGWMKMHPLPADESSYGTFDELRKETSIKVQTLLEELAKSKFEKGTVEQKIGDFYALGMDTAKIEEQGLEPLKPEFDRIASISTIEDVQNQIAHFHLYRIGSTFSFYASTDIKNSGMNIGIISQGGLGMANRDYYVNEDDRSEELRKAYILHLEKMLVFSGFSKEKAENGAQTIMNIESRLAHASMTKFESRDPHATYNKMTQENIAVLYSNFNWNSYFVNLGLKYDGDINVKQTEFFAELNKMFVDVPVEDWKTYFQWNLINTTSSNLTQEIQEQDFDFYGRTMRGSEQMKERWRRVLGTTNNALGDAIGQKFSEKHFPAEAKVRMATLVENLRIALGQRMENLEWMSEETKVKAKEKLASITVKIGYPDVWMDFTKLEVGQEAYVLNVLKSNRFWKEDELSEIGKPVDKSKWFFPAHTVNAYYAPTLNEICFPAGILQAPFFYLDGDDAINYGAIGVVIGHEMSHGFDDRGRLYDKEGNLTTWWTEEDSERFNERTQVLVNQFNNIVITDDLHADGKLSLGENIADLGGLNISLTAFRNAQKENPQAEMIEGYTSEQRFFLSYARIWANNMRDKEKIRYTKEDEHSLPVNRVNATIANMPEFHAAFDAKEGNTLYLPEEERATIW